ncbi:MAG: serine/threonine-protein kinase [Fibrobacteria bacterium]
MDAAGRSELFQAGQSFGRFYLVQLIGEGGTSRIFKAMQQPINRIVALKIPSFTDAGSILTPDEFLTEATLMARLEHGNVVRIYDFGVHEDSAFICMEYVEGWNLLELTEARGALPVSAVLAAGIQTLEGLLYAHSQNVLHLDLSPANVLISKHGSAKLSDFGMAGKKVKASEGRIVGTPAFLSPEHVAGSPGTPQSDLFSFGSLLYFAATGEPLFDPGQGNSRVTQAIREIEAARGNPPEDRLKRLPRLLAQPVLTALESKDPQGLLRELREAYKKVEGEERPESVLRREMELHGDPLAPGSGSDDVPSGQELRDRYVRLREGGKHREAVALLEKAMRKQPDNPMLRELLAAPPAKGKSAPVTMDVAASSQPSTSGLAGSALGGSLAKGPMRVAAGIAGLIVMTGALMGWNTLRGAGKVAHPSSTESPDPVGTSSAPVVNGTPETQLPNANPEAVIPPAMKTSALREVRTVHAVQPAKAINRRARRPPAVTLSGPSGTKVTVDDSLEWISPGPSGGRELSPGIVNITLTPPGSDRPISSSLFLSEDTLYLLNLEADGGFSVNRKRR